MTIFSVEHGQMDNLGGSTDLQIYCYLWPSQCLLADKVANIESREGSEFSQIWE